MIRALAVLLAAPALAQEAPRVELALDPPGAVVVGTPLTVTLTLLVPSYLPQPPAWPDLQIADAVTRLPPRATRPATERIGRETWSGLARSWQVIPQRAADYDLGAPTIGVTYADPETNAPVTVQAAAPAIAFSAVLPAGAAGMDPFLPALRLTLTAAVDGLPAAPKPGDAFTLTLTTTASGPPALLLPPLAGAAAAPPGLRAYPRQPVLTDAPGDPPTATRVEAVAYVIEAPGAYVLPGVSLDWWNSATASRETATTQPVAFSVPAPAGGSGGPAGARGTLFALAGLGTAVLAGLALAALRRRARTRPPSEARLYRALRRAIRFENPAAIRTRLAAWAPGAAASPAVERALSGLERRAYAPPGATTPDRALRRDLLAAVARQRSSRPRPSAEALPPLNPAPGPGGRNDLAAGKH